MKHARLYRSVRAGARRVLPLLARVQAEGLEHLPAQGPALLLPNHQSALDPFVLQAWAPRRIRSMTKSTQFGSEFMQWAVPRLGGFPVRRFRVDAQAVRTTLALLADGECVCIYPEGERSWDARLQPFRRGTLRTALEAMDRGIPVLPVGMDGLWDLLPRWGSLRWARPAVHLRMGAPIPLGPFASRHERDAAVPELERLLRAALLDLSGEAARKPSGWSAGPGTGSSHGSGAAAGRPA